MASVTDNLGSLHCGGFGSNYYYQIDSMTGQVNGAAITSSTATPGTCLGVIVPLPLGGFGFPPLDYFAFATGSQKWQFYTNDMNPFAGVTELDTLDSSGSITAYTPLDLRIWTPVSTPEPSAVAMLLIGVCGVSALRCRRQAKGQRGRGIGAESSLPRFA
jgi:hypothetical protein